MNKVNKIVDKICFVIIIGIFAYFAVFHGTYEYDDSFQYVHQYPMREPVYSLLLQFFQMIAHDNYTYPLGIFQNVLAIICISWTYIRVSKMYQLNPLFRLGVTVSLIAPHILTPLGSKLHVILTNSVLTEGITVSIFYVWFTVLWGILGNYYTTKKSELKANIFCVVIATILAMTRGQMVVCYVLWLIVLGYKALIRMINDKSNSMRIVSFAKSILCYVIVVLVVLVAKSQATKVYNQLETGNYVDTISSKPMLMANIVYVCDESDAQYLAENEYREAFINIIRNAKANELGAEFATGSIIDKGLYHEHSHEALNFDHVDPEIRKIIYKQGIDEEQFLLLMIEEDRICGEMAKELLPHILPKYLTNYFVIITLGFVRSVAIEKFGLSIIAVLMYVVAIGLILYGVIKKKAYNEILAMLLVLISICGTVCGTALVIQCITRYMIYNLPFFYIAGMALLQALFLKPTNE